MSITLRGIAKLAGVSPTTVSRALKNNGYVKDETRELIANIIREHKNGTAATQTRAAEAGSSSLLKHRTFTMIWANGKGAPSSLTGQAILMGISESLNAMGISANIETMSSHEDIPDVLSSGKTDGLLINGGSFSPEFIRKIKSFPLVWLLQPGLQDIGDRVQPDHLHAGEISYHYLKQKGCKKLCCITCSAASLNSYWKTREQAFVNAAAYDGIDCEVIRLNFSDGLHAPVEAQLKAAREAVEQIREMSPRPDGIFVANMLGFPIYSELVANQIIPSKDIEMVAGDKNVYSGYLKHEPVWIDIDPTGLGKLAVEALMLRLKHPEMQLLTHQAKPTLVIPG